VKTGINVVSFWPVFQTVLLVIFTAQWQMRHPGSAWLFDYNVYIGERELACFVCLFHHSRSHFTKLLTRPLFFGPCHCSHMFVYFLSMFGFSRSCCRWP